MAKKYNSKEIQQKHIEKKYHNYRKYFQLATLISVVINGFALTVANSTDEYITAFLLAAGYCMICLFDKRITHCQWDDVCFESIFILGFPLAIVDREKCYGFIAVLLAEALLYYVFLYIVYKKYKKELNNLK